MSDSGEDWARLPATPGGTEDGASDGDNDAIIGDHGAKDGDNGIEDIEDIEDWHRISTADGDRGDGDSGGEGDVAVAPQQQHYHPLVFAGLLPTVCMRAEPTVLASLLFPRTSAARS